MNLESGNLRQKKEVDERLVGKHINTLVCLQETSRENEHLRHRVAELEGYKIRADYYTALEKKVQTLQDELSKCGKLHALGRTKEEEMNEIKDEYLKALHRYKEDIEERYRQQVQSYITEKEEISATWEKEKTKMKKVEEELTENNKILQTKLEAMEAMEKDMNNLVNELDKTAASFEEIKARNEELEQTRNNLQELCRSLQGENTQLQEDIDNVSYDKKKLKKEMNKMVMKITKYIKQIRELEKFKNTVSRLEFENGWVKHLHEKSVVEVKSLKIKHQDVLSELRAVTDERNLLRTELSLVQQEVTKLKDELENSKHSFTEFLDLKRQVDILREENKFLSKKSSTCKIKMLKPDSARSDQLLVPIQKMKAIKYR